MAFTFVTNIDEANNQLKAALEKSETIEGQLAAEKLKTTATATERDTARTETTTATTRATTAETLAATEKARADKAEADLKVAKQASVNGAAAPGEKPVDGANSKDSAKETDKSNGLTGRARTTAAFATMQPALGRK